jgi:isoleucyl-tRNA synthetase
VYKPVPSVVDFPALEREILAFWQDSRAFEKLREKNRGGPRYSFIDGPITANNPMGVHHAWGRTYKDLYQRYHAMQGQEQRYQNGFDCQGLWVEVEVEKELGFNSKREIEEYGLAEFAARCRERVEKYGTVIAEQSVRLGQWMDWDDSYWTHTDNNIEHIWHFLKTCHEQGWLYLGNRSMPWCIRCGTGLSEHEKSGTDSYQQITHTSIYLALPIEGRANERFLVWTTTPWTLSSNVAVAVHPDLDYVKIRQNDQVYLLSPGTIDKFVQGPYETLDRLKGRDLVGLRYRGPFDELEAQRGIEHRVIPWEAVGEAEGTGVVHIAPGCGEEDFELSKEHGLPVIVPINENGFYRDGFGQLSGRNIRETNPAIFADLEAKGLVYRLQDYTHSYPTCWRCKEELAFRLADEWYISVAEVRAPMKQASATVNWIPSSAGRRMEDWLNNMGDWNISRKRYWGLPLPFYPCQACGKLTVIGSRAELEERATSGLEQLQELHRPWIDAVRIRCACGAEVERIPEVGDAWLDAGIVPFSTLNYLHDRAYWEAWFPAEFITEMREQIRLWFYSMLFMSVTLRDCAPYQQVLTYEKLMDEHGKAMHKSAGNAIWFDEAAEKMGADVMRWLYASQNILANLNFGYGPAEKVKQRLLTLWNVYGFYVLYAEIERFNPRTLATPAAARPLLDRWLLARWQELIRTVRTSLDAYDAAGPVRQVERFLDDLSNWYVRRSRSRFWKAEDDADKRAAFATLYEVLSGLSRLLAPFLPFVAEAIYQNLVRSADSGAPESVHHTTYPESDPALANPELVAQMELARRIVSLGHAARKGAALRVRQPLAAVRVAGANAGQLADDVLRLVADELNVKVVELGAELGDLVRRSVRLNPAKLGPKYGRRLRELNAAVERGDYHLLDQGRVEVAGLVLEADEINLRLDAQAGYAVAQDAGLVVALDTALSNELIGEGRAREIVHRIQTLRKDAGLNVEDRIELQYAGDDELARLMERYGDYIKRETLARALVTDPTLNGHAWKGEIDGLTLQLALRRAEA